MQSIKSCRPSSREEEEALIFSPYIYIYMYFPFFALLSPPLCLLFPYPQPKPFFHLFSLLLSLSLSLLISDSTSFHFLLCSQVTGYESRIKREKSIEGINDSKETTRVERFSRVSSIFPPNLLFSPLGHPFIFVDRLPSPCCRRVITRANDRIVTRACMYKPVYNFVVIKIGGAADRVRAA